MLTCMHNMAPGFWSQNPEFRGTLRRSRISMIRAAVSTTPALLVSSSHGNPRNICKDSSDSRSMEQDSSRGYDRSMQQIAATKFNKLNPKLIMASATKSGAMIGHFGPFRLSVLPITQNQTTKKKVPVERQKGNNKWSAWFAFEAECRDKPNEWQVKVLDPAHFLLDVCPQSKTVLTMALAPAFRSYKIQSFTPWFLPGSYATSSCRTLMLYNFTPPCVSSSSSCNICNSVCNFECCGMFWHCVPTKAPPYQSRVKGRLSTPRNKLAYCVLERLNCFIRWVPQWNSMEPSYEIINHRLTIDN